MDEKVAEVESIPLVYGTVTIIASAFFFQIANWLVRWPSIHSSTTTETTTTVTTKTTSTASFSSSFLELSKNWRHRNIAISWLHASIVGIWTLTSFYFYGKELIHDIIEYRNFSIYFLGGVTTGYFLYDFIDVIINNPLLSSWEILVHHIVVFGSFYINIFKCRFLGFTVVALLAEVNSIFLHSRKLLQFFQVERSHWLYVTVVFLNLFTFVSCRFVCIAWIAIGVSYFQVYYNMFSIPHYLFLVLSTLYMICINVVLFWRLISIDILRPLFGRKQSRRHDADAIHKEHENGNSLNNNSRKMNGIVKNLHNHDD